MVVQKNLPKKTGKEYGKKEKKNLNETAQKNNDVNMDKYRWIIKKYRNKGIMKNKIKYFNLKF